MGGGLRMPTVSSKPPEPGPPLPPAHPASSTQANREQGKEGMRTAGMGWIAFSKYIDSVI
jgi:hypothetical protein